MISNWWMFLWMFLTSLSLILSALVWHDIKICALWLFLFFLFQLVVYDIESQRLCICLDMLHIFTCLEFVCKNNASSDDSTCSKCIFAWFCTHTSYDHILDTLDIDALCSLSCRTVWSLYQSHDIFSHWSACSSSQCWLCISSAKHISSAHFSLWVTQSSWSSFLNVCFCWSWWSFSFLSSLCF